MKRVMAGPYIGEFGIELCMWHGWLRRLHRQMLTMNDHMRVLCIEGHEVLYKDFADSIVTLDEAVDQDEGRGCTNFVYNYWKLGEVYSKQWLKEMPEGQSGIDLLIPALVTEQKYLRANHGPGIFKRLIHSPGLSREKDLVSIVPRHRFNKNNEPGGGVEKVNWGANKWMEIVNWLISDGWRVVLTGLTTGCCLVGYEPEGVINKIGCTLNEQVDWMNRARWGFSSYTGAFPLYLQCELPSLCFGPSDGPKHIKEVFNPLDTPYMYFNAINDRCGDTPTVMAWREIQRFLEKGLPIIESELGIGYN